LDSFGNFPPHDRSETDAPGTGAAPASDADETLRLSPEDLEEAFSIAHLGVWRWVVGTQDFRWSSEFYRIVGRDPASFPQTLDNAMRCVHPADREATRARLFTAVSTGISNGHEFRLVRPDGSERICWARIKPVVQEGRVVTVRGVLLDITDQRAAEAALAESEEHYRCTLQLNPQIPWTADAEGKILDAGSRWVEAVETSPGAWHLALHPEDRQQSLENWRHSVSTGEPLDMRYRLVLRDGSCRWFRARAGARRDDSGRILRWYGLLEDIDDQVRAEAENRAREEWIRAAHEAAGLGLFEVDFESGITRYSPQSLALLGLSPNSGAELRDWNDWANLIHPEDAEAGRRMTMEAATTGAPYDFTFRVPLPDGSVRWLNGIGRVDCDAAGKPRRLLGINMDVTARRAAELKLEESEALNRAIVESSPDSIKLLSRDGEVLFANGGSIARSWLSLWPALARPRVEQALEAARSGRIGRFSAARATALGTPKWWDVMMAPVLDEDGAVQRIVAISRDITQQKQAEERIHWSATHDPLTHLPNRRLFEERLAAAIEEAEVTGSQVGLLAIDLDNLKLINDTRGHDAGNAAIRTLGDRLVEVIGPDATAARLGGDEFAVVLPNVGGKTEAARVAEAILARLREPFVHEGVTLDCRASIGASLYPCDGTGPSELLKQADLALYSSKARRGGLQMFEPSMRAELQQRMSMINIARDALDRERLCTFFQPKIKLATGRVAGFEALARWKDGNGNVHLPATIAAAFEDADLSTAMTDRIVDLAVHAMRGWIDAGIDFGHVAINASAADFRRRDFACWLLGRLDDAGISPGLVQLEITETVFLGRGAGFVEDALKLLSANGVTIALDDFGTGYASLSHLKQFPVDIIKIDRSFVADIQQDCGDAAIVEAIVNLGRSMKIEVVAEGIETATQARHLRKLGCRYGQGFLFAEAVPPSDIPALLARRFPIPSGRKTGQGRVS
jgi:diguanylate cyclase (GGDEF)-like protein/PAS domain S-box-containing protein